MYCRFCGKQIQDDSAFCPYCGKALAPQTSFSQPSPQLSSNPSHQSKPKPKSSEVSIGTLSIIASICFYLGIIGFLILYIRMAPGLNDQQIISYFIGATVVIVLAVIVNKIRKQKKHDESEQQGICVRCHKICLFSILLLSKKIRCD